MTWIIKSIGLLFCLAALLYFIKPDFLRKVVHFFTRGSMIYLAGVIRLILAILFFLAAMDTKIKWVIMLFGFLFLLGAFLIFTLGQKLKPILTWYEGLPDLSIRILTVLIFAIGAVIIYAA